MDLDFLEQKAAEAETPGPGRGGRMATLLALLMGYQLFEAESRSLERHPLLKSYHDAAQQLLAYYRSAERAQLIQPVDAPPIVGGPVSVDWFRKGVPTPAGRTPFTWLAQCERILRTAVLREDNPGELYSRIQGEMVVLLFRREDGVNPALTWAERVTSGQMK